MSFSPLFSWLFFLFLRERGSGPQFRGSILIRECLSLCSSLTKSIVVLNRKLRGVSAVILLLDSLLALSFFFCLKHLFDEKCVMMLFLSFNSIAFSSSLYFDSFKWSWLVMYAVINNVDPKAKRSLEEQGSSSKSTPVRRLIFSFCLPHDLLGSSCSNSHRVIEKLKRVTSPRHSGVH